MKNSQKYNLSLVLFFAIFLLSGFSGLIYESIWSRYLKLFLGHASYAQMLVLIIFMGGMAIGSALAAKYSFKFKNLILIYGIVEVIVGIFGIFFHQIFTTATEFTFNSILTEIESSYISTSIKFTIAALIILPQSILLGATFPLISAGILNKFPATPGSKISTLYFLNSLGASVGIIFSAFYFVPKLGLPGTSLTAGIINIFIGIIVYGLTKGDTFTVPRTSLPIKSSVTLKVFLVVSFVTGLASFVYEIAWIRMLSMVLGASTDAFEIMLSSFILGLAIGSLAIKNRIDTLDNPILTLARIQVIMGVLAALTIPLYNYTFDLLAVFKNIIQPNALGYNMFNIASFLICALVMLPTTICAGMTLPLITNILIKKYNAQSSIGTVYSFNTIGAIIGVIISVQLIMPLFGLKTLLIFGALLDISLGLFLFYKYAKKNPLTNALTLTPIVIITLIAYFLHLDFLKMSSGVFRHGNIPSQGDHALLYQADGKTSTVSVYQVNGRRGITNNGKPEAAIQMNKTAEHSYSFDEPTMKLLGILPFIYNEKAKNIANIGFGSGLTAETVLLNSNVQQLDTIEIEQKVIDASKHFYPYVKEVHSDKRSKIIVDDAKTYFVSNNKLYDVIISEPPNPWVSGVSSLFTYEFYELVTNYLSTDGVFVQWIHLYETNPALISSVYKSLRKSFAYIDIYQVSTTDIAIIARNEDSDFSYNIIDNEPKLKHALSSIDINNDIDLYSRKIAGQDIFDNYFLYLNFPLNSDFFPVLDHGSAKARFIKQNAKQLYQLGNSRILHTLLNKNYFVDQFPNQIISESKVFPKAEAINSTIELTKYLKKTKLIINSSNKFTQEYYNALTIKNFQMSCDSNKRMPSEFSVSLVYQLTNQFNWMTSSAQKKLLQNLISSCGNNVNDSTALYLKALLYWFDQKYEESFLTAKKYIDKLKVVSDSSHLLILKILIASNLKNKALINIQTSLEKFSLDINTDFEFVSLYSIYSSKQE